MRTRIAPLGRRASLSQNGLSCFPLLEKSGGCPEVRNTAVEEEFMGVFVCRANPRGAEPLNLYRGAPPERTRPRRMHRLEHLEHLMLPLRTRG